MKVIDYFACPRMVIACLMVSFFILLSFGLAVRAAPAPVATDSQADVAVLKNNMQQMMDADVLGRTARSQEQLLALDKRLVEAQVETRAALSQMNNLVLGLLLSMLTGLVAMGLGGRAMYRKVERLPETIRGRVACPLSEIDRNLMHSRYNTWVEAMNVQEERLKRGAGA